MDDAGQITKDVATKMGEFKPRFDRMDEDFDRWDMKMAGARGSFEYQTRARDRTRDTDIEITSNKPRTFCDGVQAILSSSERQIAVRMAETQGEDMRERIAILERLLEFAFEKADERLINLLLGTLKENLVWYSIVRGWIAARFLVYKSGGNVIFDFLPYDPRWLVYWIGANGLTKTGYTTSLSPEAIREEYGEVGKEATSGTWWKAWEKKPDTLDVIDCWKYEKKGKISNSIVCNNKFLKEPETYDMKSMPVLIAPVATRPPVRGALENEMEGYGESILAPNRKVDDLLNKCGSMWASHANLLYKQPTINYYDEEGKPLKSTAYLAEAVINLPMGHNRLEPSTMKEISPTLVNLVNWLDSMRASGALPDVDIGKPPPSGTLYNLVQETSNRVFNPQLRNLNSFYGNACRLIEEQIIAGGVGGDKIGKFKIKGQLKNEYYETQIAPIDLKRPHIIKVEFTARTPWQQMDTYMVADMAKRLGLPDGFIQEYILKLPDPKGLGDLSAIEMAEHSPKLAMVRAIQALMKVGRNEEAEQLMQDMYNMTMQEEAASAGMEPSPPVMAREASEAERTVPPPA